MRNMLYPGHVGVSDQQSLGEMRTRANISLHICFVQHIVFSVERDKINKIWAMPVTQ